MRNPLGEQQKGIDYSQVCDPPRSQASTTFKEGLGLLFPELGLT